MPDNVVIPVHVQLRQRADISNLIQARRKKWGGRGGLGAPLIWPSLVTLVVVLVVAVFVRASSSERSKSFTDARCKVPARLRDIVLTFLLTFYLLRARQSSLSPVLSLSIYIYIYIYLSIYLSIHLSISFSVFVQTLY